MRHDDDIGVSVTRMLDDMPAETKEKILSAWCKEIKHAETKPIGHGKFSELR